MSVCSVIAGGFPGPRPGLMIPMPGMMPPPGVLPPPHMPMHPGKNCVWVGHIIPCPHT